MKARLVPAEPADLGGGLVGEAGDRHRAVDLLERDQPGPTLDEAGDLAPGDGGGVVGGVDQPAFGVDDLAGPAGPELGRGGQQVEGEPGLLGRPAAPDVGGPGQEGPIGGSASRSRRRSLGDG